MKFATSRFDVTCIRYICMFDIQGIEAHFGVQFATSLNTLTVIKSLTIMKTRTCASYFLGNWHEVAKTFALLDYVREMPAKKSCKYSRYG